MVQKENEEFIPYSARIHSEFRKIRPFRDGNGPMGRILLNLLLMQNGYPILVLPTTIRDTFKRAVEKGQQGDLSLFTRLLGEAIFQSLQAYEDGLGVELLPNSRGILATEMMRFVILAQTP